MSADADPDPGGPAGKLTIAGGVEIPTLGLGVFQIPDGPPAVDAVRWALEAGYRHIDTAQAYGNEASVGRALAESGVPREHVFLTSKFASSRSDPVRELESSLERLGVGRLDLYLVHTPRGGPTKAWPAMERALELGLTRSIGVSNFDVDELDAVIAGGTVRPAVNQVQFSPFQYRRALLDACRRNEVALEAYSPLTRGRELSHPVVAKVATECAGTPAQVLIGWALQHGLVVIPKSARRERIAENHDAREVRLSDEQMRTLDALDRTGGTAQAVERRWWTLRGRTIAFARRSAGRLRHS